MSRRGQLASFAKLPPFRPFRTNASPGHYGTKRTDAGHFSNSQPNIRNQEKGQIVRGMSFDLVELSIRFVIDFLL